MTCDVVTSVKCFGFDRLKQKHDEALLPRCSRVDAQTCCCTDTDGAYGLQRAIDFVSSPVGVPLAL